MVNISFRVWDFKHIMKTCGTIVDPKDSREMLRCIRLRCEGNICTAHSATGYQFARCVVPCILREADTIVLTILPVKIPKGTEMVDLTLTDGTVTVLFYDIVSNLIQTVVQHLPSGEYMDIDRVEKNALENIDQYNSGAGQYSICFNRKYLIAALNALDSEGVRFNFASPVDPAMIRPIHDSQLDTAEFVLPVRS